MISTRTQVGCPDLAPLCGNWSRLRPIGNPMHFGGYRRDFGHLFAICTPYPHQLTVHAFQIFLVANPTNCDGKIAIGTNKQKCVGVPHIKYSQWTCRGDWATGTVCSCGATARRSWEYVAHSSRLQVLISFDIKRRDRPS